MEAAYHSHLDMAAALATAYQCHQQLLLLLTDTAAAGIVAGPTPQSPHGRLQAEPPEPSGPGAAALPFLEPSRTAQHRSHSYEPMAPTPKRIKRVHLNAQAVPDDPTSSQEDQLLLEAVGQFQQHLVEKSCSMPRQEAAGSTPVALSPSPQCHPPSPADLPGDYRFPFPIWTDSQSGD